MPGFFYERFKRLFLHHLNFLQLSEVKTFLNILSALVVLCLISACKSKSYVHQGERRIEFANRTWQVKGGDYRRGPGNNYFGTSTKNVYTDWQGNLHLKLHQAKDRLYCVELNTLDTLGYGRYSFTLKAPFYDFEAPVVLGLFTWDHSSFDEQANSEIDIEFSKWGFPLAPQFMHYSVHPVALERLHLERTYSSPLGRNVLSGESHHIIEWRDTSVTFYSYSGTEPEAEKMIEYFHYSGKNPPRQKSVEGKRSAALAVPKPGKGVQAHINLWLAGPNKKLKGKSPEVVFRDFKYEAF